MKSIQPFIQRKVIVLHDDDPVQDAAKAMREHSIGCVVVSDRKSHIVGIVTDRDIVNDLAAEGKSSRAVPIAQVMTRNPVTVGEGEGLTRVVQLMEENGIRRIPVLHTLSGGASKCIGLVTLDDVISGKAVDAERLGRIVRAQLKRKILVQRGSGTPQEELQHFIEIVSGKLSSKLEVTHGQLQEMAMIVLGALVRRLHHTGALQLINTLPRSLQERLLGLPSGPDETVDLKSVSTEVSQVLEIDDATAYVALIRFGAALGEWCDPKVLEHVKAQLPNDLRGIFVQVGGKQASSKFVA